MSSVKIIGVDPGLKGGLVVVDGRGRLVSAHKMPLVYVKRNRKSKQVIDPYALADIFLDALPDHAVVEDVFATPQMGVVSAATFQEGKGFLLGICAALKIPVLPASPNKWKKDMGLTADKNAAKALARSLFTDGAKRLPTEGICEAALIAIWGAGELGVLTPD
jgi:crossover junction endodeoxyribonuclease RuvC